jgi:hypothetical protein
MMLSTCHNFGGKGGSVCAGIGNLFLATSTQRKNLAEELGLSRLCSLRQTLVEL